MGVLNKLFSGGASKLVESVGGVLDNFITTKDLASAVQSGINQTINLIQGDFRTRRALGL